MALPTTISGITWPATGSGNLGPYIVGSNVYVLCRNTTNDNTISMFKATDPTSSFSEQDSGDRPNPNLSNALIYIDSYFDGSSIHIMAVTNIFDTYYMEFDTSSDVWLDVNSDTRNMRIIYEPTDDPTIAWGGITVRSDGDVIIVHPGENPSTMGGTYQEVYYSRIEGTSLTAGVTVASTAAKNDNYLYAYVVMGSSDQCHFGYVRDTDSDFYLRALDSTNNLRTQRTSAGTYAGVNGGANYTRSSTEKIAFGLYQSGNLYKLYFTHFTDDSSPTFTVETITTASSASGIVNCGYAYDSVATNQDNYQTRIGVTDADIYLLGDDGGTTWSDQNGSTAIRAGTINAISGNVYTRGGNRVYAFLYYDAGTVKYDEFTLYAVTADTSKPFARRPVRFFARNF